MPLLPLLPAQEEEVLCAYLKRTGTMLIRRADLELEVWFALSSIIRMPRGGVSGNGSQYGSTTPLRGLPRSMISAMFGKHCNHYPQTRFGQDAATGKLVAVPVKNTDSWVIMKDEKLLGNLLMLHKRLPRGAALVYKNAKLVRPSKGCHRSRVLVMLVPPFIVEHTKLRDGRTRTTGSAYTCIIDDLSTIVTRVVCVPSHGADGVAP